MKIFFTPPAQRINGNTKMLTNRGLVILKLNQLLTLQGFSETIVLRSYRSFTVMSARGHGDWRRRLSSGQGDPNSTVRLEFVRDPDSPIITRRSCSLDRTEIIHKFIIRHNFSTCTSPLDVEIDVGTFYRELLDEALGDASAQDVYSVYINSETLTRPILLHQTRVENNCCLQQCFSQRSLWSKSIKFNFSDSWTA